LTQTDSTVSAEEQGAAGDAPAAERKPSPPTRLVLVRHAVTHHTGPILSGRLPGIDLSEEGVRQAEAVADRLATVPVAAVYASPIERTTQTAERIAARHGLAVRPLAGVIEADYGEWTGARIAELAKTDEWKVVQVAPSRAVFPGGEALRAMQARTVATLEEVVGTHRHETVVVVSHADPIRAAIAHFVGLHLDQFQRLHVAPASVSVLEFDRFTTQLLKYSDTGALDELRPPAPASDADSPEEEG
jgi:probable phosphomutase (TIGR03848 family)